MRNILLAVITILGLGLGIMAANAQAQVYHAPVHNYYQNKWMAGSR